MGPTLAPGPGPAVDPDAASPVDADVAQLKDGERAGMDAASDDVSTVEQDGDDGNEAGGLAAAYGGSVVIALCAGKYRILVQKLLCLVLVCPILCWSSPNDWCIIIVIFCRNRVAVN